MSNVQSNANPQEEANTQEEIEHNATHQDIDQLGSSGTEDEEMMSDTESNFSAMSVPDDAPPFPPQPSASSRPVMAVALSLAGVGEQMFLNPTFADCRIVCAGHSFPAHRLVLSGQCEFFCGAFRGAFREAKNCIVEISDERPATIYRMLSFLYRGTYSQSPTASDGEEDAGTEYSTKINFGMYRVADKFGIPGLSKVAAEMQKFNLWETRSWVSENKMDVHATKHAYRLFSGRYDAMRMVCMASLAITLHRDGLVTEADVRPLCEEHEDLGPDLQQWSEWERAFFNEETPTSRPEEWVRNSKGGWDVKYGWGQGPTDWDGRLPDLPVPDSSEDGDVEVEDVEIGDVEDDGAVEEGEDVAPLV